MEWSSAGEGVGAMLTLTWTSPVQISQLVSYDRPNAQDQVRTLSFFRLYAPVTEWLHLQVLAGKVTFSDESSLAIPPLPNNGSALPLYLSAVTTTQLVFTVTAVSSTTKLH